MADIDLDRLAQTCGIRLLLQFGSTATGDVHPGSDVDFLNRRVREYLKTAL